MHLHTVTTVVVYKRIEGKLIKERGGRMRGRENGRMDAVDANFESMSTAVRRVKRV